MQRQAQATDSTLTCWQQQSVSAEVVEPDLFDTQIREHPVEAAPPEQLPRQKMVALQSRVEIGSAATVDVPER